MRTNGDQEAPTTVVNLSGNALSEAEINLLLKRPSFCPTTSHIEKEHIVDNLEKFILEEEELEEDSDAKTFSPPSTWMPHKRRDSALETYIKD